MNKRCILITSYLELSIRASVDIHADDFVVCADGGMTHAIAENVIPDVVIGDFDSSDYGEIEHFIDSNPDYSDVKLIRTVPEKDDTDTLMCVKHAMDYKHDAGVGCTEFVIVGGLGGRLDHTFANLQILSYLLDNDKVASIVDGESLALMIEGPKEIELAGDIGEYFSIYSFTEKCTGIYEKNSKYLLNDATIGQSFPMGTSNEFLEGPALISVEAGKLLIIKP